MKRYISVLILILTTVFAATSLFAAQTVIVKEIKGKVQIKLPDKDWTNAAVGMTIDKGTTISTGFKSQAVLELGKTYITVEALTRMKLEELLERDDVVQTDIYLNFGKVKAEVKSTDEKKQDFKLKSPVSTAAVRGTSFVYDMYSVTVIEGLVDFMNTLHQKRSIGRGGRSRTGGKNIPDTEKKINIEIFTVSSNTSDDVLPADSGPDATGSIAIHW